MQLQIQWPAAAAAAANRKAEDTNLIFEKYQHAINVCICSNTTATNNISLLRITRSDLTATQLFLLKKFKMNSKRKKINDSTCFIKIMIKYLIWWLNFMWFLNKTYENFPFSICALLNLIKDSFASNELFSYKKNKKTNPSQLFMHNHHWSVFRPAVQL